eukprot:7076174-Alexandrium_andersonii.AAC.1
MAAQSAQKSGGRMASSIACRLTLCSSASCSIAPRPTAYRRRSRLARRGRSARSREATRVDYGAPAALVDRRLESGHALSDLGRVLGEARLQEAGANSAGAGA